ncbi:hypothetical protein FHG87_023574 [Trinorchestia longiramus]|nr:hypothetical protein FHG87_023574 [Trinorchestia longiramus]
MLWEVTDKDTDLLTGDMIERMIAVRNGDCQEMLDLPSIIAASKPMCNRFITAAAIVVYGLPCSFKVPKTVTTTT